MTSHKNGQFCEPLPHIGKYDQQIYCFKTIESANTGQILRPPHPLPCGRYKCIAPYGEKNCSLPLNSFLLFSEM